MEIPIIHEKHTHVIHAHVWLALHAIAEGILEHKNIFSVD